MVWVLFERKKLLKSSTVVFLVNFIFRSNSLIVWIGLTFTYLNKVKMTGASLNVKRQEVEGDHITLWLVNDPLTDPVVGIGVGVVRRA